MNEKEFCANTDRWASNEEFEKFRDKLLNRVCEKTKASEVEIPILLNTSDAEKRIELIGHRVSQLQELIKKVNEEFGDLLTPRFYGNIYKDCTINYYEKGNSEEEGK